mmetsp:Transcript_12338/g.26584  ORF Transcript_12338/g.26584 Transcript_12338/m.26584 type:complete len:543 (+) Transcript_12338:566-2194(+)
MVRTETKFLHLHLNTTHPNSRRCKTELPPPTPQGQRLNPFPITPEITRHIVLPSRATAIPPRHPIRIRIPIRPTQRLPTLPPQLLQQLVPHVRVVVQRVLRTNRLRDLAFRRGVAVVVETVRQERFGVGRSGVGIGTERPPVHETAFLRSVSVRVRRRLRPLLPGGGGVGVLGGLLGEVLLVQRRQLLVLSQLFEGGEFASAEDADGLAGGGGLDLFGRRRRDDVAFRVGFVSHFPDAFGPLVHVLGVFFEGLVDAGRIGFARGEGGFLPLDDLLLELCFLHGGHFVQRFDGGVGIFGGNRRFEADGNLRLEFHFLRLALHGRSRGRRRILRGFPSTQCCSRHAGHGVASTPLSPIPLLSANRPKPPLPSLRIAIVPKVLLLRIAVIQLGLGIVEKIAKRLVEHSRSRVEEEGRPGRFEGGRPFLLLGRFVVFVFVVVARFFAGGGTAAAARMARMAMIAAFAFVLVVIVVVVVTRFAAVAAWITGGRRAVVIAVGIPSSSAIIIAVVVAIVVLEGMSSVGTVAVSGCRWSVSVSSSSACAG